MKKILKTLLIFCLLAFLVSCSTTKATKIPKDAEVYYPPVVTPTIKVSIPDYSAIAPKPNPGYSVPKAEAPTRIIDCLGTQWIYYGELDEQVTKASAYNISISEDGEIGFGLSNFFKYYSDFVEWLKQYNEPIDYILDISSEDHIYNIDYFVLEDGYPNENFTRTIEDNLIKEIYTVDAIDYETQIAYQLIYQAEASINNEGKLIASSYLKLIDKENPENIIDIPSLFAWVRLSNVVFEPMTDVYSYITYSDDDYKDQLVIDPKYTTIADTTFMGSYLSLITLTESITEIGPLAFSDSKIQGIVIPSRVTKISKQAFRWCRDLKVVYLPEGITEIGVGAFEECNKLETIIYAGTKAQWDAIKFEPRWNNGVNKDCMIVCLDAAWVM